MFPLDTDVTRCIVTRMTNREHPTITRNREHRNDIVWQSTGRKQYERYDGCRIVYNCNRWVWDTFAADGTQRSSYSALWVAKESFGAQA